MGKIRYFNLTTVFPESPIMLKLLFAGCSLIGTAFVCKISIPYTSERSYFYTVAWHYVRWYCV